MATSGFASSPAERLPGKEPLARLPVHSGHDKMSSCPASNAMLNHYRKLLFIDLETTGPNPATDRITEIGIVEVTAAGVQRWSTLVNPEVPIPPFIQNLTGINDDMVRSAPTFSALKEEVLHRLEDGLFIAHNARFDYGFLRYEFKRHGMHLHREVLCTVKLSRKLFPEEVRHSLDALIDRHGLSVEGRHRALADAELIWQFWERLQASVPEDLLLGATQQLLQRPNLPAHLDVDALEDLPDAPGVYVFYDEHDVPLHVGKAAHLRQRVLSHFHADRPSDKDVRLAQNLRRLEWQETAGEVGTQLLEARWRKRLPSHGQQQAQEQELCAWELRPSATGDLRPELVYANSYDFGGSKRLYGLFITRQKAEMALRALAQQHALCPALLGLEPAEPGKPCSAYLAQRCSGACIGKESLRAHQQRLEQALAALKIQAWPFDGTAALVETAADGREALHLVDNWCYLGTAWNEQEARRILGQAPAHPAFDPDTYRIASRALNLNKVKAHPLPFD
ncbi:MAG TPA: exonuclease domain-containing protein [Noviherbaspirillum sp.]|nr:exonuclease domain-containing protein [Noviherbaspirillum sp.]